MNKEAINIKRGDVFEYGSDVQTAMYDYDPNTDGYLWVTTEENFLACEKDGRCSYGPTNSYPMLLPDDAHVKILKNLLSKDAN